MSLAWLCLAMVEFSLEHTLIILLQAHIIASLFYLAAHMEVERTRWRLDALLVRGGDEAFIN